MYVGQGPALTLLSAAFLGASYLCALSGRGDAPQSCAGTRALSVLGQPQAARVAQRDVGGTGRGQKSQRAQRLGELAQRESCPCALGGRWPGAPGLAPGWGRSAHSWGGLEGHAACQQQGDCGQKAPVRPRGGPRLPRLGSEKVAGSGVWPWPSRNEGSLVAVPWGPAAVSISCHTPVAWVSLSFFLHSAALLHHLGFIPVALSLGSAYVLMQKPNGSGDCPVRWPGRAGRRARRRLPAARILCCYQGGC